MYYDAQGKMKYYDDQYDNYHQQHYQLHWNQWLGKNWTMNVALHYTHDNYYYEQMKMGKKLYEYLLTDDLDMRARPQSLVLPVLHLLAVLYSSFTLLIFLRDLSVRPHEQYRKRNYDSRAA
jgi:hypothetical protein